MAQTKIQGFPYKFLVRAPMAANSLLATVLLLSAYAGPRAQSLWFALAAGAGLIAVLVTGLLQLYALPRGIYLLWQAPGDDPSQLHEGALLCGALHLGLSLFLFWSISWVY